MEMKDHDALRSLLAPIFGAAARAAIPDSATILPAVEARLAGRQRNERRPKWRLLALPAAVLAVVTAGTVAFAAATGGAPIQFVFQTMPGVAPRIPPPGTQPPCQIVPHPTTISAAKSALSFPIFTLSSDPQATLLSSEFAEGCGGSKGLGLVYTVAGTTVGLVEGPAPLPNGPAVVKLKGTGHGDTAAQAGWSTVNIAGHEVAVAIKPTGKGGSGGVYEAWWQIQGTLFTLSPKSLRPDAPIQGISMQVLEEIVTDLTPA